jgi:hypothetical protein
VAAAAAGAEERHHILTTTMNRSVTMAICALSLLAAAGQTARAQFPEDVLRYSWQGIGPGGRSLAMGTSGMSFLSDYSAVYWNPAGIAQARLSEFSTGISYLSYQNDATYLGTTNSFTNNQTSLDHLGLIYAVPTARGRLSIGIGYDRTNEYTTGLAFKGFNPRSSIVQSWAPDGQPYPPDEFTRAEILELAFADTLNGTFISPITDSVSQAGTVLEGGGMGRYSFSVAAEVARKLYLGGALNFLSGSYSYSNRYNEDDTRDIYQTFPFDYYGLEVLDIIDGDVSGFTINAGMIYEISPAVKFGLSMRTPSWITVQERFTSDAISWFDNGDSRTDPPGGDPGSYTEYDISTPWVFSTGLSYGTDDYTLAGSAEFTDYTQMEFDNATSTLLAMNTDIKETFRSTINLRLGGEARIPTTDLLVRAGYILLESPYRDDPSSFNRTYITGGLGLVLDRVIGIDLSYAYGSWETYRYVYQDGLTGETFYTDKEDVSTHNFKGTVSFSF